MEAGVRIRDSTTCTQEKNKWLLSSHMKEIPITYNWDGFYLCLKETWIDGGETLVSPMATRSNPGIWTTRTPAPTPEEQKTIFRSISGCTVNPAVLPLVAPLNEQYTCKEIGNVPKPLPNSFFFREECLQLDYWYIELLQQCQQILLEITPDECGAIEASARKQSQYKVWYQMAGRQVILLLPI